MGQTLETIVHKAYKTNATQEYDVVGDAWSPTGGYSGTANSFAGANTDISGTFLSQIFSSDNAESPDIGQTDMHRFEHLTATWVALTDTGLTVKYEATGFGVHSKHYSAGGSTIAGRTNAMGVYGLSTDAWAAGTVLSTARGRCNGGSFQNLLGIIVKGEEGGAEVDDNLIYDVADDSWSVSTADTGQDAEWGGAAFQIGLVYQFGGRDTADRDEAREYDPLTDSWSALSAMTIVRQQPSVVPHGDRLFAATDTINIDTSPPQGIVGITLDGSGYPDGDKLDVNIVLGTYQRRQSAADKGLVVGGNNGSADQASVQIYDQSANAWSAGTILSATRAFQTSFPSDPFGDRSWQIGGQVASVDSNTSIQYYISGASWESKTAVTPANLIRSSSARLNGKGYTFGGRVSSARINDIYELNFGTEAWSTKTGVLTADRDNLAAVSSDEDTDNAFIVSGNEAGSPVNDLEEYDASGDTITGRTDPTNLDEEAGVFSVGGSDQIGYFKDTFLELYDISGDSWAIKTNPSKDAGTRGLQVDYSALLVGGESLNTAKRYLWESDSFVNLATFTTARGHFGWNNNSPYS